MNPVEVYEELKPTFGEEPSRILAKLLGNIYDEITHKVTKQDFAELKSLVAELVSAQRDLAREQTKLSEAQNKTEEKVSELTEAQKKTEERIDRLSQKMEELTEAQKKTEERVDRLSQKVEELTEAQKKTEILVQGLIKEQKRTSEQIREISKQLGGLATTVGYGMEDKLYPHLERFAQKHYNVKVIEKILRKNFYYEEGKFREINIFLKGKLNEQEVYILGECKAHPSKKDIDRFWNLVERFELKEKAQVYPFFVGYNFHDNVEKYIKQAYPRLKYFKTYEIEYE